MEMQLCGPSLRDTLPVVLVLVAAHQSLLTPRSKSPYVCLACAIATGDSTPTASVDAYPKCLATSSHRAQIYSVSMHRGDFLQRSRTMILYALSLPHVLSFYLAPPKGEVTPCSAP